MNNSSHTGSWSGVAAGQAHTPAGPSSEPPDNVSLLTHEAQLTAPDSVMEVNVLEVLKEYLKAGGKVQTAVQDLSDGYMGLAHMADLVCEWADLVDMPLTDVAGSGNTSGTSLSRSFSSIGASRPVLTSSAAAAAAGDQSGSAVAPDGAFLDVLLLQELVKERFDPTRFLSVFKKGHPEWLDKMIQHKPCRQMIYELSAANKNSLLLNYAIQRILKQGHEEEVAQVGSSLASYFDVYHRLLASRLAAAARATDKQQLRSIAGDIVESSVAHQHTYVHAQQLLTALAQLPGGGVFRRLSEEVEAAAAERHGGVKVYQLQPLFVPRSASALECQAAQLVSDVLVRSSPTLPGSGPAAPAGQGGRQQHNLTSGQLAAAEAPLVALQELYGHAAQLSVQPLRHPKLMQLLLSGMYVASDDKPSAASGRSCSMRELCIRLLALAVAGRSPQGHAQQQDQQQHEQQQQQQEQEQRRSLSPEVKVAGGAEGVAERLRLALALTKRMAGTKLLPQDLDSASQVCRLPAAALGLLQHSQQVLAEEAFYSEEKLILVLPNHLSVLHRVACEQPGLIPQVLTVLHGVLVALGANHHELVKSVLSFLVSLIVSGAAAITLDLARQWSVKADPSLTRHFVQLVLESVAPPYSEGFVRVMLAMMEGCRFKAIKSSHVAMLREFSMGCRDIIFRPPLDSKLQALLEELGS